MDTVSREELWEAVNNGDVVLLEALPPDYFQKGHLPGAHNLPLDEVERLVPELVPDKDKRIVTYCSNDRCNNSTVAADWLRRLGYRNVRKYPGGKQDWAEAGLPLEGSAESGRVSMKEA